MKAMIITHPSELDSLEEAVKRAPTATVEALRISTQGENALEILKTMKFDLIGFDPLKPERPLNLIKQVNQAASYLVTFRAVEYLFETLPVHAPFRLNIGARGEPISNRWMGRWRLRFLRPR